MKYNDCQYNLVMCLAVATVLNHPEPTFYDVCWLGQQHVDRLPHKRSTVDRRKGKKEKEKKLEAEGSITSNIVFIW